MRLLAECYNIPATPLKKEQLIQRILNMNFAPQKKKAGKPSMMQIKIQSVKDSTTIRDFDHWSEQALVAYLFMKSNKIFYERNGKAFLLNKIETLILPKALNKEFFSITQIQDIVIEIYNDTNNLLERIKILEKINTFLTNQQAFMLSRNRFAARIS